MPKLMGQRSGTAWAGRTGEHKHRASQVGAVAAGRDRLSWRKSATTLTILI